jgi:hypothetical protein
LQVLQQVDDLRLDRHVERRHRLVADDQLRAPGQRPGDADALALAAGELVRIALGVSGAGRPRRSSSATRLRVLPRSLGEAVHAQRLARMSPTVMRGFSEA